MISSLVAQETRWISSMQFGSETSKGVDDEDRNCLTRLFGFYMMNSLILGK